MPRLVVALMLSIVPRDILVENEHPPVMEEVPGAPVQIHFGRAEYMTAVYMMTLLLVFGHRQFGLMAMEGRPPHRLYVILSDVWTGRLWFPVKRRCRYVKGGR